MLMELILPHIEKGVSSVQLVRWIKEVGDRIEPGEDVLTVDTQPRVKLHVPRSAKLLSKLSESDVATGTRQVNVRVRLHLTAAEPAYLQRVTVPAGTICNVGDVLALVTTGLDESAEGSPARPIKLVVNEEGVG